MTIYEKLHLASSSLLVNVLLWDCSCMFTVTLGVMSVPEQWPLF